MLETINLYKISLLKMFSIFNNLMDNLSNCSIPMPPLFFAGFCLVTTLFFRNNRLVDQEVQTSNELLEKLIGDKLLEDWSASQSFVFTGSIIEMLKNNDPSFDSAFHVNTINGWINNLQNTPTGSVTSQIRFLANLRDALNTEADITVTQNSYNNSTFNFSIHSPTTENNLLLISEPHYTSTRLNSPNTENNNPILNNDNSLYEIPYNYSSIFYDNDSLNDFNSLTELALAMSSGLF
jgi:hypothetical protein